MIYVWQRVSVCLSVAGLNIYLIVAILSSFLWLLRQCLLGTLSGCRGQPWTGVTREAVSSWKPGANHFSGLPRGPQDTARISFAWVEEVATDTHGEA